MGLTRRELLNGLWGVGAAGALGVSPAAVFAHCKQQQFVWRNWSGAQSCIPLHRHGPADEQELADLIRQADYTLRPVGSAHSFSPLVPTSGGIVSLGRMSGLIGTNRDTLLAEWWAGTRMSDMGAPLKEVGQALPNMADIDYQTLAGAISTSTHGTGVAHQSYSPHITGLRLVTASGEIMDLSADSYPEIFNAAKVSLGALGVITRVQMQNRKAFRLREHMWMAKTEDLLDDIERLTTENDHWEMQVITNSEYAAAISLNETEDPPTKHDPGADEGGNEYVFWLNKLDKYGSDWPAAQRAILNWVASGAEFEDRVDDSYEIYANVRNVRFNEMEYEVAAEDGPACLRRIIQLINEKDLPTWFPIEYRYIKADDIPLSMFNGRDSCAISIHQHYSMSYHDYFAAIEPIFWEYGGRPHWGKLHSLNAPQLKKLYPRWGEFTVIRDELDPQGKFLNGHLRNVFGA